MYKMAAYCRLSRDDGENKVSESIENQLKIIQEYAEKSEDLEIVETYIDDGFSGMYFDNRPGFQRMMEDIYKGKLQGVITKDISRLGREHIETGRYIERVFPSLNIRFIAILDHLDSLSHRNEELAQFQTLFNDMYCRDISRKIRGSLQAQKKQGNYMSGFAPYGYKKDPENRHHLLVDEEAAQVVKRIFQFYIAGYSRGTIARILNEEGILPPSEYKRNVQGLHYANAKEKPQAKGWAYPTLSVILKNRIYTGDMVQHKTEKISYKIDKYRYIPTAEQIIVEGTHEPIIDRDTYEQVQNLMKNRTRTPGFQNGHARVSPYAGILVCGDCGCRLQRVTCRDGYDCATYHRKGNAFCKSHFISKAILDEIIKAELTRQAALTFTQKDKAEIIEADHRRWEEERKRAGAARNLERMHHDLDKIRKYQKKTFEHYADGLLSKEEYLRYQNDYAQQEQKQQDQIRRAEEAGEKAKRKEEGRGEGNIQQEEQEGKSWIETFVRDGEPGEVTRELVAELIDHIVIQSDRSIDLVFRFCKPMVLPLVIRLTQR